MDSKHIDKTFHKVAADYDRNKLGFLPEYEKSVELLLEYLVFPPKKKLSILELGPGTGAFAEKLLHKFSGAVYMGLDISQIMLDITYSRLKKNASRLTLQKADLNQDRIKGCFDLVVSLYTLHHVENKRALFSDIYDSLKENGVFAFIDVVKAQNFRLEEVFLRHWREFMESGGLDRQRVDEIIEEHVENDRHESVEFQLDLLERAGFRHREVTWKQEKFAMFVAGK